MSDNSALLSFSGVRYIGGEVRLGGFSFQVGFAINPQGQIFAYGSGAAPAGIVATNTGAFNDPQLALALGIAAIVSAKSSVVFGASSENIDDFLDWSRPNVSFNAHYNVGFNADIEGKSIEFTYGPGFAIPGLQVNVTGRFQVGNFILSPLGLFVIATKALQESLFPSECFASGTLIRMGDGTQKPIDAVRPGDIVLAFDGSNSARLAELKPRKVVKSLQM
jgi:hypothetical protein